MLVLSRRTGESIAINDNVTVTIVDVRGDKVRIGIDAPRVRADQAKCTPDIAYRSVMATYDAGGHGVVLSPNYASMKLTNLDGVAKALTELGLKE